MGAESAGIAPVRAGQDSARCLVLLGSTWSVLRTHNTRWASVIAQWRRSTNLEITTVDFPRFTLRHAVSQAVWRESDSWMEGVRHGEISVPARRAVLPPLDTLAWAWVGNRISKARPGLDLVIAATPLWVPALPHIRSRRRGFDAVDDWRAFDGAADLRERVRAGYRALGALDSITANTRVTAERLGPQPVDVIVVPNGVDVDLFSRPSSDLPKGLPEGPFAVYVGVIEGRIDTELLSEVARTSPLPIVVAGAGDASILAALRSQGVICLGKVDHAQVPGLLQRAAVGLIPHRVTDLTQSMDPLKLLEYLAAGLPVVSTRVAGAEISDNVVTADNAAEFAAAVATQASASRARPRRPDPAVLDRQWSIEAKRLLEAHLPGVQYRDREPGEASATSTAAEGSPK